MSFELEDFFPNAAQGLSNIGFLFGAGASFKAGYPLMPKLTVEVIAKLTQGEVDLLDSLVERSLSKMIDKVNGDPDIEVISDITEAALFAADNKDPVYHKLESVQAAIREKIVEILSSTKKPYLDDHIRFFTALNRLLSGRSESVWIFTPNYDLLFEIAASLAKVPLFNGFIGTSLRFFNIQTLDLMLGAKDGQRFSPLTQPLFRLIKLHGSLDWWKDETSVFNTQSQAQIQKNVSRVMILPRRRKVTETLEAPFGDIFRFSDRILGPRCKYLVSCGYGYGDEHINGTLLLPKLQQAKIRLTAFIKSDTPNLDLFKNHPPFSFGNETFIKKAGNIQNVGTDLWEFDKFVDLLCKHAGV